ncbi:MAG: GNAT family N-acetyltransferase [Erysipelotrichaceae bacterium]|nr:GNAT family N-acetyltransferase [Erysipelotrichaceae bacterium]
MSNIIRLNEAAANDEWIVMSNQGTDCFLDLLIVAADSFEKSDHQKELISFLRDRKNINDIAPGTAGFDLDEIPWQPSTLKEDAKFLARVTEEAQRESTFRKLPYEADTAIVIPWLEHFGSLISQMATKDPCLQPEYEVESMKQIFESEHISFVEVTERLVNDYLTMVNDYENVNRFIGSKKKSFTVEQELQWVRNKLDEKALVFSMIEKKSGRFIGNIELMDPTDSQGELGIAITAKMQNSGFGTEAVIALSEYAIDRLGMKRVFLRTDPNNSRAIHVYQKCGFKECGRTDGHIYMELCR